MNGEPSFDQEGAPASSQKKIPTQRQLWFPLVETIQEMGGGRPKEVVEALADRIGLPDELRTETVDIAGKPRLTWDRHVRWTRQTLVTQGYISKEKFNHWELTEAGREHLVNCKPGVIVTVYETDQGVVLWAEAQSAAQTVAQNSLQLIFTSPPYPLVSEKDYGNLQHTQYLDWLLDHAKTWKSLLTDDGSLFLNLGEVWNKGLPTQNLYIERLLINLCDQLGYHLAQRFYWENPTKIPSSHWVTVRRCRVTPSIESIFWLSKTPWPAADNRNVLKPYSEHMTKILARGGDHRNKKRPSGHGTCTNGFCHDNGGSIPHSLIVANSAASNGQYFQFCRENQLPLHPARFPGDLPEFALKLTTQPGDITADFFGGSLTFAEAAHKLGRRFITSDKSLAYLRGGAGGRLRHLAGFRDHTIA